MKELSLFRATRTEVDGRVITKTFTVDKVTTTGILKCVSQVLRLRQLDAPTEERNLVLNNKKLRAPYMPLLRVAFRANFKLRKNGVWTDTAQARKDGTTRWQIIPDTIKIEG